MYNTESARFRSEEHKMSVTVAPPQTFSTTGSRSIDLSPAVSELTVAQAARFLDVPEGYVNEMLNAGRVVFRHEGGERLIERDNLQDYWQERERRNAAAESLFRFFEEMGLSDD